MNQDRYERQSSLIGGKEGQLKLKDALVTLVGAGAIGNIAAKFLASAGVGTLILIDNDKVDKSNLHRQILFNEKAIGNSKAYSLAVTLAKINSENEYKAIDYKLTKENVHEFINPDYGIVLDCTDDIGITYLLQEYCLRYGRPLVYGKTSGFYGSCGVIKSKIALTQQDIEKLKNVKEDNLAYPPTGGVIGSVVANLVLKLILGLTVDEDIFYYDSLRNGVTKIKKGEEK